MGIIYFSSKSVIMCVDLGYCVFPLSGVRSTCGKHRFKAIYEKSLRQFVYSLTELDFLAESMTNAWLPFPFKMHHGALSFPGLNSQLCCGRQAREGAIHLYYD